MEWISVKDKIPNVGEALLICVGKEVMQGEYLLNGNWSLFNGKLNIDLGDIHKVTHWMNRPKPPIESESV